MSRVTDEINRLIYQHFCVAIRPCPDCGYCTGHDVECINYKPERRTVSTFIKPTVGRVVLFHASPESPLELRNAPPSDQPNAAIIVYVHTDRLVNLVVFDAHGTPRGYVGVPLIQDGDPCPRDFYCEWMPYQKAVASGEMAPVLHAKA